MAAGTLGDLPRERSPWRRSSLKLTAQLASPDWNSNREAASIGRGVRRRVGLGQGQRRRDRHRSRLARVLAAYPAFPLRGTMLADLTFWLDRQKGDQMNKQFSSKYWRRMFWAVVVCLSLGLAPSQALAYRSPARLAGSVQLAIDPPAITVSPGQVFTLQVLVRAGTQQVDGAEAHLDFNPAFVRVRTLTPGAILSTILENKFDNANGTVDYAAGTLVRPRPSGTFTLAQIEFEALAVTPGVSVAFHFGVPRNSEATFEGASMLGGTSNATISVQQTSAGSAPFIPPLGAQAVGLSGGVFTCAQWSVSIPAGVVPNSGAIHCGGFNPNGAPPAPAGFQLLQHTVNVNIYNNFGSWITAFNPPLAFCLTYTDADLAAASGHPNNLVIQTAPIGRAWNALATTVDTSTRRACARVSTLNATLFDLSARGSVSSATNLSSAVW